MKKVFALALVAVLALTGCATGSPGTAAKVGNSTVPVSVVESVAAGLQDATKDQPVPAEQLEQRRKTVRATVLSTLIVGNLSLQVAADHGISVSGDDIMAVVSQNPSAMELARNERVLPYVEAWATQIAVLQKLNDKDQFAKEALSRPVEVNPRYGHWNLTSELNEAALSGSLSVPGR